MIVRKTVLIILCLLVAVSSYGCIGLLFTILGDEIENDAAINIVAEEPVEPEDKIILEPGEEYNNLPYLTDEDEDLGNEPPFILYELDMSSAEAFIDDVKSTYNLVLLDRYDYLSGADGKTIMHELSYALSLFTPRFIMELIAEYEEYGSEFSVHLEGPSSTEFGMTEWDRNLIITLHYDRDPDENGITAAVLAHELAHAIHFIIEEYIGEDRSMLELRSFNDAFNYVDDDYDTVWDPDIHGFYFAYDYGMYDYYEDFATVIEMLVAFPDEMLDRLSDHSHDPLARKTMYLRDIVYQHVSETGVFDPLYKAEVFIGASAA